MAYLSVRTGSWSQTLSLPAVNDDKAILVALETLWTRARTELHPRVTVFRVHVTLVDLTNADSRQIDMLLNDDAERQKCEAITQAMDSLNSRYSKTVVSLGLWNPPKGGNVGGKISYTRIPTADDFWWFMNWKLELQLYDLEPQQRLEMTCKQCGHVHYRLVADLLSHPELTFVWLNEIERDECCHKQGCRGSIRLAMCLDHSTSGFVGGLA